MDARDIVGKKISVIGAARSGLAAAALLKQRGARVFVSDNQSPEKIHAGIEELHSMGIDCEFGRHSDRVFDADLLVISPGVRSDSPVVEQSRKKGIPVVRALELASWFCTSPIIAVTGSNGKTTTTTLLGRMFADAKRAHVVGGNIGTAFSSLVDGLGRETVAILEVSSFQLDYLGSFHPAVSVILNITPDHLDRYGGSFEIYSASKCRIVENQTAADHCIYCLDDEETRRQVSSRAGLRVRLLPFSAVSDPGEGAFLEGGKLVTVVAGERTEIVEASEISIKGVHNLYNAMAASLAARIMGIAAPSIRATLKNFKGVEHRLEPVRDVGGVRYINDSKATNVASVWYALQAYSEPIVLLLGGRDKGNEYSALASPVKAHVKAIVAIGESAEKVIASFRGIVKVVGAHSMPEAVRSAAALASPGDIVLLSPACASFDWFENYEHRGREFKRCVNEL
jgi:UDP-N-acetylmuramoylalanine--D-glutamate ligase